MLDAHGVASWVLDEHTVGMNWLWSHGIGGVKLAVSREDAARAAVLLGAPAESPAPAAALLRCPACGSSELRQSLLANWSLLLWHLSGLLLPFKSRRLWCRACGRRATRAAALAPE